jgi:hypothetical protein
MAHHETDSVGRVFGLQRTALRKGRMAVWDALVLQRQVDETVLTGLRAGAATHEAAVEFGVDTARDVLDRLDGAFADESAAGAGPLRRVLDGPLDAVGTATAAVDGALVGGADEAFDRYERGLRTVLHAFNRRLSALLEKHEALEARLREYVDRVDEDERTERVAEYRRQLSTLRTELQAMQAAIDVRVAASG